MTNRSEEINALLGALFQINRSVEKARKSGTNPHHRYSYADLGDIAAACDGALKECGVTVSLHGVTVNEQATVATVSMMSLHLDSLQWMLHPISFPIPAETTPQMMGSLITYARKYALAGVCGVLTEDDDGQAASPQRSRPTNSSSVSAPPRGAPKDGASRAEAGDEPEWVVTDFEVPKGFWDGKDWDRLRQHFGLPAEAPINTKKGDDKKWYVATSADYADRMQPPSAANAPAKAPPKKRLPSEPLAATHAPLTEDDIPF